LLAKGQFFKKEAMLGAEGPKKCAYQENGNDHTKVLSHSTCGGQRRMVLESQADGVLASPRLVPPTDFFA